MQMRIVSGGVIGCIFAAMVLLADMAASTGGTKRDLGEVRVVDGRRSAADAKPPNDHIAPPVFMTTAPGDVVATENGAARDLANVGGRLHIKRELIDEERDRAWEGATAPAIQRQVSAIPFADPATVNVDCRSTLCRATGAAREGMSPADREAMARYVADLQFADVDRGINASVAHVTWREAGGQLVFTIDYARIRK